MHKSKHFVLSISIIIFALIVTLPGCGFKLRGWEYGNNNNGQQRIKELELNTTSLKNDVLMRKFIYNLNNTITSNNIAIVNNYNYNYNNQKHDKNYKLVLLDADYDKKIISTGSNKLTTQYQINFRINFSFYYGTKIILTNQTINASRNYNYIQDQILGLSNEEDTITNELIQEVANRILTQLIIVSK